MSSIMEFRHRSLSQHKWLYIWIIVLLFGLKSGVSAQYITTHISHQGIYELLDELASGKIIDINTSIRPYSRKFIRKQLLTAKEYENLTQRQRAEIDFYLLDYGKEVIDPNVSATPASTSFLWINKPENRRFDMFFYRDSAFQITVNPILGGDAWVNENGFASHWWNGAETHASYKNFGLYASLRDNHESSALTNRDFMNQRIGASNIKNMGDGKRDYWEMRGGMTYAWKWGHVGLMMDQFVWGYGNNGTNIFSGRTPAFARIELQLDPAPWLQFNYVHGWLVSEVVDSSLSFWVNNAYGSEYREVYHPKFLAANMFTFKPFDHFYIGAGNSIIYDSRSPQAAFFIPVMFWKPVDHTLNASINNMNSQLFFTLSSRNIRGLHLYSALFIDEVQVGRIFDSQEHNPVSVKAGMSIQNIPDVMITAEYLWSNVIVYKHNLPVTTFESNQYNLGHYLEDNAREIWTGIKYSPVRAASILAYFCISEKGPDHTLIGTTPRTTITPLEPIIWRSKKIGISGRILLLNNLYLRAGYEWRDVTGESSALELWSSSFFTGKTSTWSFGLNYGF